jgi:peptidoglycan DL-endopeptidase CwlO
VAFRTSPPRTDTSSRPVRRAATFVALTAIAILGVLGSGVPAQAKPSAAELKKEIAALNDQIEQNAEQFNGATVKLQADQAQSAALAKQILPLQLQATIADQQLGTIAANLYMSGSQSHTFEVLLNTSSTQTLLDELGALNEMARGQKFEIDNATDQVKGYQDKKTAQDALVLKDKALVTSLAATKKTVNAKLASLQKLQDEAGGGSSGGRSYTKSQLMPYACPRTAGSGKGATAVKKACSLIWQPSKSPAWTMYKWATEGPSTYDCSGFTLTAWKAAGVTLEHFTGDQWTESNGRKWTSSSKSQLEVGDLIFYYSDHHHVAIYIGDGWIAQAATTGEPLKESSMGSPSGWGRP